MQIIWQSRHNARYGDQSRRTESKPCYCVCGYVIGNTSLGCARLVMVISRQYGSVNLTALMLSITFSENVTNFQHAKT